MVISIIISTIKRHLLTVLGQGGSYMNSNNLQVMVEFSDISNQDLIMRSLSTGTITDQDGNTVGQSYSICIEDYIDHDYNDVYINAV